MKIKRTYQSDKSYKTLQDKYKDCFSKLDNQFDAMLSDIKCYKNR